MDPRSPALCVVLCAALLASGCAGNGEWWVSHEPEALGPEVSIKSVANTGLAILYAAFFPVTLVVALSDDPSSWLAFLLEAAVRAVSR